MLYTIFYVCSLREYIVVYSNGLCNDGHLGCLNGTQKSQLSVCKPFNMFYDKKNCFALYIYLYKNLPAGLTCLNDAAAGLSQA